MSNIEDARRYKWSDRATNLLVSIWSHDLVQNRLKVATRNRPIWESIARFMVRKGFDVTGLQCRTRVKNMLCAYFEAIKKRDRSLIEPYFDVFKKIVTNRTLKKKESPGTERVRSNESYDDQGGDWEMETVASTESSSTDEEQASSYQRTRNMGTDVEQREVSHQESQAHDPITYFDLMANFEYLITKAIEEQTKIVSHAIKTQSEKIEKLLMIERKRIAAMIHAEKERRKGSNVKVDKMIPVVKPKNSRTSY